MNFKMQGFLPVAVFSCLVFLTAANQLARVGCETKMCASQARNFFQLHLCAYGTALEGGDAQLAFDCLQHHKQENCEKVAKCKWVPVDEKSKKWMWQGSCHIKAFVEGKGLQILEAITSEFKDSPPPFLDIKLWYYDYLQYSFVDGTCGSDENWSTWCNSIPDVYNLKQGGKPVTKLCVKDDAACRMLQFPMEGCATLQPEEPQTPREVSHIDNRWLRVGCETRMCAVGARNYFQLLLCAYGTSLDGADAAPAFACIHLYDEKTCNANPACKWLPHGERARRAFGPASCHNREFVDGEGLKIMEALGSSSEDSGISLLQLMPPDFYYECLNHSFDKDEKACPRGCSWCESIPDVYNLKQGGKPVTKLCVAGPSVCKRLRVKVEACPASRVRVDVATSLVPVSTVADQLGRVGCETKMCASQARNYYQLLLCAYGTALSDADASLALACTYLGDETACNANQACKWLRHGELSTRTNNTGSCHIKEFVDGEGLKIMNAIGSDVGNYGLRAPSILRDRCLNYSFDDAATCRSNDCAWCESIPDVYGLKQNGGSVTNLCVENPNKCRVLKFAMEECSTLQPEQAKAVAEVSGVINRWLRVGCETKMCSVGARNHNQLLLCAYGAALKNADVTLAFACANIYGEETCNANQACKWLLHSQEATRTLGPASCHIKAFVEGKGLKIMEAIASVREDSDGSSFKKLPLDDSECLKKSFSGCNDERCSWCNSVPDFYNLKQGGQAVTKLCVSSSLCNSLKVQVGMCPTPSTTPTALTTPTPLQQETKASHPRASGDAGGYLA